MYNLIISNQHVDLTDALTSRIKSEFSKHANKFDNFIHGNVHVTIKVENNNHIAECLFHSKKHRFFASHESSDMYSSIDNTFKDVFKQTKKHKEIATKQKNSNKRDFIAE